MTRAHILLKADQDPGRSAWLDDRIAGALNYGVRTVEPICQCLVETAS
jgi:hypothetical protein